MATAEATQSLREYTQEISVKAVVDRLPELFEVQSEFTPEQKVQTAAVWLMTGSAKEASLVTGINPATIRDWTTRKAWWPIAVELARKLLESKLDNQLDRLLRKDLAELEDRLENGDDVITKDGEVVKKRVGARDCAIIADILYNKRAALRGQPGNITEKRDATALLDLIRRESGKHGKARLVEIDPATVIQEQAAGLENVLERASSGGASGQKRDSEGPETEGLSNGPTHLNAERM